MRLFPFLVATAAAVVLLAARPAGAETILSPQIGGAFGSDLDTNRTCYGLGIAFMGGSVGLEFEGNVTPDFYGTSGDVLGDNNVTTLMANLMLGSRVGHGGRIYATAGAGLLKSRVKSVDEFFDVSSTDFGVNAGVGAMAFFNHSFGLRADVRYFRNLADPVADNNFDISLGGFSYWRGTAGLAIKF